jgi:hypothetical protein
MARTFAQPRDENRRALAHFKKADSPASSPTCRRGVNCDVVAPAFARTCRRRRCAAASWSSASLVAAKRPSAEGRRFFVFGRRVRSACHHARAVVRPRGPTYEHHPGRFAPSAISPNRSFPSATLGALQRRAFIIEDSGRPVAGHAVTRRTPDAIVVVDASRRSTRRVEITSMQTYPTSLMHPPGSISYADRGRALATSWRISGAVNDGLAPISARRMFNVI